jgi:hypothetical protein
MDLRRTPLLFETSVPVDWPAKVGLPAPGMTRKRAYPASGGKPGVDVGVDEYPCTPEGKKIAKSHAWQFLKPVKVCGKKLKY